MLRVARALVTFVACANSLTIGLLIWAYAPPGDPSVHIIADTMYAISALTFVAYVLECVELNR
jgi:hypothetical protein